ncbi:hypothetical protein [Pseudomonas izuensis]|uniref:hypothetical protein n=1 Tax=Pseudomonas izuensis TaxID=2684212 RepID=UPI001359C575|nr:hypothetical protein [Pseudomonas izuensis]
MSERRTAAKAFFQAKNLSTDPPSSLASQLLQVNTGNCAQAADQPPYTFEVATTLSFYTRYLQCL